MRRVEGSGKGTVGEPRVIEAVLAAKVPVSPTFDPLIAAEEQDEEKVDVDQPLSGG